jgi:hypothetical protein
MGVERTDAGEGVSVAGEEVTSWHASGWIRHGLREVGVNSRE